MPMAADTIAKTQSMHRRAGLKLCTGCGIVKPIAAFRRLKNKAEWYHKCGVCMPPRISRGSESTPAK